MLIELVVGSAILLFGVYLYCWIRSASLREHIERPKHAFLRQVREFDRGNGEQA